VSLSLRGLPAHLVGCRLVVVARHVGAGYAAPIGSDLGRHAVDRVRGRRVLEQLNLSSSIAWRCQATTPNAFCTRCARTRSPRRRLRGRASQPDHANDALYQAYQWNLRRIGMEQAWDLRPGAADVMVAVLDTGVDLSHPDLRPNLLLDQGYDFSERRADSPG